MPWWDAFLNIYRDAAPPAPPLRNALLASAAWPRCVEWLRWPLGYEPPPIIRAYPGMTVNLLINPAWAKWRPLARSFAWAP